MTPFLDAHWTGSGEPPESECPLLEELAAIAHFRPCDVLVIDDAPMFANPPGDPHDPKQWPTADEINDTLDRLFFFEDHYPLATVNNVFVGEPTYEHPMDF